MNNQFTRTKKFTVSSGPNNSIKIFDAETGSLYRTFPAGGTLINQPIVSESQVVCEVKVNNQAMMKYFSLPSCSLVRSIPIGK